MRYHGTCLKALANVLWRVCTFERHQLNKAAIANALNSSPHCQQMQDFVTCVGAYANVLQRGIIAMWRLRHKLLDDSHTDSMFDIMSND